MEKDKLGGGDMSSLNHKALSMPSGQRPPSAQLQRNEVALKGFSQRRLLTVGCHSGSGRGCQKRLIIEIGVWLGNSGQGSRGFALDWMLSGEKEQICY